MIYSPNEFIEIESLPKRCNQCNKKYYPLVGYTDCWGKFFLLCHCGISEGEDTEKQPFLNEEAWNWEE